MKYLTPQAFKYLGIITFLLVPFLLMVLGVTGVVQATMELQILHRHYRRSLVAQKA